MRAELTEVPVMVRKVLAVIAGIIAGMTAMFFGVTICTVMYRPEDPKRLQDPEAFQGFVEGLPPTAFVIVLAAHVAGTLVGGATCALVAQRRWTTGAIIIGVLFLLGGIGNLMTIPHPTWFAVVDLLAYVPAALVGNLLPGCKKGSDENR